MTQHNGFVWARNRASLDVLWPDRLGWHEPMVTRPLARNCAIAAGLTDFVTALMRVERHESTDGRQVRVEVDFEQITDHSYDPGSRTVA